jgi:hypothetical protein
VSASWRAIQVELYLHVNTILAVGHTLEWTLGLRASHLTW